MYSHRADSRLPWREVREGIGGPRVAAELGLTPARERGKYACVRCGSSDALHVYPIRIKCYSCGWGGSVIDLAALALHVSPAEACETLASRFGIGRSSLNRPVPRIRREAPDPTEAMTQRRRTEVYGDLVAHARLGVRACQYLKGRRLNLDLAAVHGIRSFETPGAWKAAWAALESIHGLDGMLAAGFHGRGEPWYPWGAQVPAVLLPYVDPFGQVVAVRWRRITPGDRRYMAPLRSPAPIPWGAEALSGPGPLEIVLVEGEFDALAARMTGYDAIALGGATPSATVVRWIVENVRTVDALVLWPDDDNAGRAAMHRIALALGDRYGAEWVLSHVFSWRSERDPADILGSQ